MLDKIIYVLTLVLICVLLPGCYTSPPPKRDLSSWSANKDTWTQKPMTAQDGYKAARRSSASADSSFSSDWGGSGGTQTVKNRTTTETNLGSPEWKQVAETPVADSAIKIPVDKQADAKEAFEKAKATNTYDAYDKFLMDYPFSKSRPIALQKMSALIEKQKGSYEDYRRFVSSYEDGIDFVSEKYQISLVGPEGMRVQDIAIRLKKGFEANLIAAKIRMGTGKYKEFSFEEIGQLKRRGFSSLIIEAMLDSTTRVKRDEEELQKKKNMEDLLAEIQRMQKKLDNLKTSQVSAAAAPVSSNQNNDSSVVDAVTNCAAQITALEACKHLPRLGAMVCKVTAKSQFPCE